MVQHYFNPFTWSMRRREMFLRCPREYFYHYCASAGGAFAGIFSREAERLHLLRSVSSMDEYVRKLLLSRLRELFTSGAQSAGAFPEDLAEQFQQEFRAMLTGKNELDHRRPLIRELTLKDASPQLIAEQTRSLLAEKGAILAGGALTELLKVPPGSRLDLPFPLKVCWNELECFVTPVAAWLDEEGFHGVCAGKSCEENSALLTFYALQKFHVPPEKVRLFYLEEERLVPAEPLRSSSAPFRRIRQDADMMLFLELQLRNALPAEKLFPGRSGSSCGACRFSGVCGEECGFAP